MEVCLSILKLFGDFGPFGLGGSYLDGFRSIFDSFKVDFEVDVGGVNFLAFIIVMVRTGIRAKHFLERFGDEMRAINVHIDQCYY